MKEYIKVAIVPSGVSIPFGKDHPARIIVNFVKGDDGGPATPMAYKVWAGDISKSDIRQIYKQLCDGAAVGELPNGMRFSVLRHLSN